MRHILIADAGATKVEWALITESGDSVARLDSDGINALMASAETAGAILSTVKKQILDSPLPDRIFYYGAGCATPEICGKMKKLILECWPDAQVEVTSDLLGAARALFGKNPGIACILGTGSNSCLYDGKEIAGNVPSLGFILGDEGSGAALGKRLLGDAFKGRIPALIRERLLNAYNLTLPDILDKLYRQPAPNKFLASFVPFIKENIWNPYIFSLVLKELTKFIRRNVALYPGAHSLPVSFTGSIAYHFSDILNEAVSSQGYSIAKIEARPMEGLIKYHADNDE